MSDDYRDLLETLLKFHARFLVVGAHALAVHGYPRSTVDIDVWIERTPENAGRVWAALADFGAPLSALGIRQSDFQLPDTVTQLGVEPGRIDIMTDVTGVEFHTAWPNHISGVVMGVQVPVSGLNVLIAY